MAKQNHTNNAGWILIAIGTLFFVSQFVDLSGFEDSGLLVLPAIATVFLMAALVRRCVGLLVPSGILYGIGATAILTENPMQWAFVQDVDEGVIFFFSFAAGWASIALFALLIERNIQWWALVVSAIFALIGASIGLGGVFLDILEVIGKGWPAILIVIGLWSLFGKRATSEKSA